MFALPAMAMSMRSAMSDRPNLRVAGPDEKPTKVAPKTISEAVESGSSRDVLASMRKALAKKLDDGDIASNAIASAYKELRELDRLIRIADLDAEEEAKRGSANGNVRRTFNSSAI